MFATLGHGIYATAQLKTIHELVTPLVLASFSVFVLREPFTLNYAAGQVFIAVGAFFVFRGPF